MARRWTALAALLIVAAATHAAWAEDESKETDTVATDQADLPLKGYGITPTRLKPKYPRSYACSPLTSLYASWIDVDGTRRDEIHSGVDGGRLGEPVLAPAPGTVRRAWVADWGQGHEGALLLVHTAADLNMTSGPKFYYSAYYHLRYDDVRGLKEGDRIARGQKLATVFRPGGQTRFLPEVHVEIYEVDDDDEITWGVTKRGTPYFDNPTYRLVDPLYLLSLEVRPNRRREVSIQPFVPGRDYSAFKGFTYFLRCGKRSG
jgi:murein DD-endopeptidase MepM/ murein hydrolase activator NlpD